MPAQSGSSFRTSIRTLFSLGVFSLTLVGLTGCGGSKGAGGGDTISGKVTLNGKPVGGQVIFVSSDKTESAFPLAPDGTYTATNVPKGEMQVLVKSSGVSAPPPLPKGAEAPPGGPAASGVAPPAKYAQPNNGLKFTVTGGAQTYDIDLK